MAGAKSRLVAPFMVDGEIYLLDERGIPNLKRCGVAFVVSKAGGLVTFCIFDLLFRDGRDTCPLALVKRKELLRKLLPRGSPVPQVPRALG